MHGPHRRRFPAQSTANLHQATRIAGYDRAYASFFDRLDLVIENRDGNFRIFHRKRSAKTAACVGVGHFDEFSASHLANQTARLAVQIQIAQAVTSIMPSHAPAETRAEIVDAEHVDDKGS